MKNNQQAVLKRRQQILQMVLDAGEISVTDLAQAHNISDMTVRRDLQYLEGRNLIWRTHGGANSIGKAREMNRFSGNVLLCRNIISEYAAGLVNDGDRLFINGSRTALNLLKHLNGKKVLVYTNNAWAVGENYPEGVTICLTGGELRNRVMIGEDVMRYLLSVDVDKIFIGCAAVYDDGEFRYDIPTEIGINESLISRMKNQIYVLADHSKLVKRSEQVNSYGSSTYEKQLTLITDDGADSSALEKLRKCGLEVIAVPVDYGN